MVDVSRYKIHKAEEIDDANSTLNDRKTTEDISPWHVLSALYWPTG